MKIITQYQTVSWVRNKLYNNVITMLLYLLNVCCYGVHTRRRGRLRDRSRQKTHFSSDTKWRAKRRILCKKKKINTVLIITIVMSLLRV